MASRESCAFILEGLPARTAPAHGLNGVEFVVADDHAGLRAAVREGACRSRLPTLLHPLPPQRPRPSCRARPSATTACKELRWLYDRRVRSRRPARTSPHLDRQMEQPDIPSSSAGSRKPSRRRSPSTKAPARQHHISISKAPICSNASTRKSNAEPTSLPDLPQRRRMPTPRPRPYASETHENWLRSPPLSQHERSQGAQKNQPPPSRIAQPIHDRLCRT